MGLRDSLQRRFPTAQSKKCNSQPINSLHYFAIQGPCCSSPACGLHAPSYEPYFICVFANAMQLIYGVLQAHPLEAASVGVLTKIRVQAFKWEVFRQPCSVKLRSFRGAVFLGNYCDLQSCIRAKGKLGYFQLHDATFRRRRLLNHTSIVIVPIFVTGILCFCINNRGVALSACIGSKYQLQHNATWPPCRRHRLQYRVSNRQGEEEHRVLLTASRASQRTW